MTSRSGFCSSENLGFGLALLSSCASISLVLLSIVGFDHLAQPNHFQKDAETQATFGCLCFLGTVIGMMLFFSEFKWERFFYLFGFLRYRLGRAIVYQMIGIMSYVVSKNMNDRCRCYDYTVLQYVGLVNILVAICHLFSICFLGNNSTSVTFSDFNTASNGYSDRSTLPPPTTKKATKSEKRPSAPEQEKSTRNQSPVVPTKAATRSPTKVPEDPNMPSWMNA